MKLNSKIQKSKREVKLHKNIVYDYDERHKMKYSNIYHSYWNAELMKEARPGKKLYVLDYGCGTGILLKDLVKRYNNVYGVDISKDMLERVDKKNSNLKDLKVAMGEKLPFNNCTFDIIFCRGVLHHLENIEEGINELNRVLKSGGELIISEPNNDSVILKLPRLILIRLLKHFEDDHRALGSKFIIRHVRNNNFTFNSLRRHGFVAFPLGGLSELIPILRYIPLNTKVIKILITLDVFLSKIPIIKTQSWHNIVKFKKNEKNN